MLKRLLAIFAVLMLFLAGCGDDDGGDEGADTEDTQDEDTDSTEEEEEEDDGDEPVALDDWAEGADELCAEADEALDDLGTPDSEDEEEMLEFVQEARDLFAQQLEDMEALGVPEDEADTVEEALGLMQDQMDLLDEAVSRMEDGESADDVFGDLMEEGDAIEADLDELAEELGLEECGSDDGTTDDTTDGTTDDTGIDGEPFTYGDDERFDALWDECEGGDMAACDELYQTSPIGSDYELFGGTCGGEFEELADAPQECANPGAGGGGDEPFTYGDDAALDELWDACEAGDGQACDDLYFDSPLGSEYEEFGMTCGGRLEGSDAEELFCADEI
jgi:hypothetical protein